MSEGTLMDGDRPDQIEFADVIVLSKPDLVDEESTDRLRATLTRLNPAARIAPAIHGRVPVGDVLDTRLVSSRSAAGRT